MNMAIFVNMTSTNQRLLEERSQLEAQLRQLGAL